MSSPLPVFLIDLDSVLIAPCGYRKAIQSTLNYFTSRMGLGDLYPGEEVIARLEAINMTSEWDITPILLAADFEGLLNDNPGLKLPADLLDTCDVIRKQKVKPPRVDLAGIIAILGAHFSPGMEYASLAYDLNQSGVQKPPFPRLAGHPLLASLLTKTRDLNGALTTRVFQHFTLGSARFEKFTSLTRLFDCESYLEKYDQLLLMEETNEALLAAWESLQIGVVLYTARPSLPEKNGATSYLYSPEAEVALETLGLTELPLIGAGKMGWLADELHIPAQRLAKPSPVQALAAIAAAVTRQTEPALRAAAALHLRGEAGFYRELPPLSIHVFEDSGGNTASVRCAVDELIRSGLDCTFTAWGIAENPAKQQALQTADARLVPDINQALQQAFKLEGIRSTREVLDEDLF